MSIAVIRNGQIQETDDDDFDVEFLSPNQFLSTHVNQIPLQNAVSAPRLFYGARFYNQAVPLINPETPLVQNLVDGTDQSFDELLGEQMGAVRSKGAGTVRKITPDFIEMEDAETKEVRKVNLYNNMPFNRKTMITNTPLVQEGDIIEPGQLLAKSNYTDDQGRVAMGVNARIGLVPFKGHSMDDAVVISESFAKRLTSQQAYSDEIDFSDGAKGGMKHFVSLFPTEYTKEQLANFDENGVVKPGTILNPGDPYILATKPRMITSNMGAVGKLSRAMANTRQNASRVWDHEDPAEVVDVAQTRKGFKVIVKSETPAKVGDKMVERHGQKGIISKIIPDTQMPRTTDGEPLEVLLNPMGIPSRVNDATPLDLLLGKVAKKRGEPFRLGAFNQKGESWVDFVERTLAENELSDVEEVFDPSEQRKMENPITVGYGHILKLHHMGESKVSSRSQGAYDQDQQPLKGGSEAAQAKRLSTLELGALLSSGAYATMREGSTLRGQQNDDYWRAIRQGQTPKEPGEPFAWEKFKALLTGSGLYARNLGDGRLRLGPFTDRELAKRNPARIERGGLVDPVSLEPESGGLFDPALVGNNRWGKIELRSDMPNPAFEKQIALLLGIKQKDLERVVAGEITLEDAREK